jgi:hypothetical protein
VKGGFFLRKKPLSIVLSVYTNSENAIPQEKATLLDLRDKAYDSDALGQQMSEYGIEIISPNRSNRKQKTQEDAHCAATTAAGRWNGSLPGCRTTADWLHDGNTTLRTSSASRNWPAF